MNPSNITRWLTLIHKTLKQVSEIRHGGNWDHFNHTLSHHCPILSTLRLLLQTSDSNVFDFSENIKIEIYGNSLHIYGFPNSLISPACVAILAHSASLSPFVVSIEMGEDVRFVNGDGSSSIQADGIDHRPYHDAGLNGEGQICGVADSGVNDLSCFFADEPGVYRTHSTSRSWGVESRRRKIIQYVPYADSVDDEGGHGTHTCGTLAGSSASLFKNENGIACSAKIAFFDIGFSMAAIPILIPRLHSVLFPTAYAAGARVHSNSWAGGLSLYAEYSLEIDSYLYENPDFAVVLAAGNRGLFGPGTVGSPANSKNAICVGSTQLRSAFDDVVAPSGPVVSLTSSIGPTLDGRLKPDILAVGEGVISAYSSSVDNQYHAQQMRYSLWSKHDLDTYWNYLSTCAVHEKSGTSMATPLIAGSALLVRQYFMEKKFWASICPLMKSNKEQSWCTNFEPSGYLLKALILHGGKGVSKYSQSDMSILNSLISPPDIFQGYGAFGLNRILPLSNGKGLDPLLDLVIYDQVNITENSLLRYNITFPSCEDPLPLKITVSWFDPPSLIGWMSHLLIHDIDIVLISPSKQEIYWGNNITGGDHANPNEQIYVFRPHCSNDHTFTLLIRGHHFPFKKLTATKDNEHPIQSFALVITTSARVDGPMMELINAWPSASNPPEEKTILTSTSPILWSKEGPPDGPVVSVDFYSVPLEVSVVGNDFLHNNVEIARFADHFGFLITFPF